MRTSIQTIVHEDDPKIVLHEYLSPVRSMNMLQDNILYVLSVLGLRISVKAGPSGHPSGFG